MLFRTIKQFKKHIYFWGALFVFLLIFVAENQVYAKSYERSKLVIALDPGHGGKESGAYYYGIKEKDINLMLAKLVQAELERYEGVEVFLTREMDEEMPLYTRANVAYEGGADILISMHFNASNQHKSNGASVYVTTADSYRYSMQQLADCLLGEFEAIGLENAGTFARVTELGGRWSDGSFQDYYGVLKCACRNGMPSLLIEHCFMDSAIDRNYFDSVEGLKKLAKADANGIAAYFGLVAKTGDVVQSKHATEFGMPTKAIELGCKKPPNVTDIRILSYEGKTPEFVTYEVEVEDEIGITSMYLVYKNEQGNTFQVNLILEKPLTTGKYRLKGMIPQNCELGTYTLSYIGAYNKGRLDAGYNHVGNEMIGFGNCDWLNRFSYYGTADVELIMQGSVSTAYAKRIEYEINMGLRDRRNIYPQSIFFN